MMDRNRPHKTEKLPFGSHVFLVSIPNYTPPTLPTLRIAKDGNKENGCIDSIHNLSRIDCNKSVRTCQKLILGTKKPPLGGNFTF